MKKILVLAFAMLAFVACKQEQQRHFMESAEIDMVKSAIEAYEKGDMDNWRTHFADTAKIYPNSTEPLTVSDYMAMQGEMIANFSSYGFDKEDDYMEMVIDGNDETWVYYWADWNGTLKANGETLTIPVHLAIRFHEGKVIREHGYWDNSPINNAMAALAAAEAAAAEADDGGGEE